MAGLLSWIGTISLLAGAAALRLAWRRSDRARRPLVLGGWAGLGVGLWAWSAAAADAGLAIAMLIFMGAVLLLVARDGLDELRRRRQAGRHRRTRRRGSLISLDRLSWAGTSRDAVSLSLALIGAGCAALLIGLALLAALQSWGLGPTGAISAAFLLLPLIWTGLTSTILVQPRLTAQAGTLACGLAAAGLLGLASL